MNFKNIFSLAALFMLLGACSSDSPSPTPEETVEDPMATTLIFPENNTECNEGIVIDDNQSKVTFQWEASQHTDFYEIYVKRLSGDSTIKVSSDTNEIEIAIQRGTAYEWYVISKADDSDSTAKSEVWKFYNAGNGVINHAPFPADVIFPEHKSEVLTDADTLTLEWSASDIDGDIVEYEVFFGNENPPTESLGKLTNTSVAVDIVLGNTYYWFVKTFDNENNSSESDIFQFEIPFCLTSNTYEGDAILLTQDDVDEFAKGCYSTVTGALQIGEFFPEDPFSIVDISSLGALTQVGGRLTIYSNDALLSLDGLDNITYVGGYLSIYENLVLESMEGLGSLNNMGSSISIIGNPALKSLQGLNGLDELKGNFVVRDNKSLLDLKGLDNVKKAACIFIDGNSELKSLEGLDNLTSTGCLYIKDNLLLEDFCSITDLFKFDGSIIHEIHTNLFNPTREDLENDRCSP